MSYGAALDVLAKGPPPNIVTVVGPRGALAAGDRARSSPAGLGGDYLAATLRSPLLDPRRYGARRAPSLEGFLFPATYELKRGRASAACWSTSSSSPSGANFASVDAGYARQQEPDALRRADDRLDGRARGRSSRASGGSSPR